jgi:hypothetical protein
MCPHFLFINVLIQIAVLGFLRVFNLILSGNGKFVIEGDCQVEGKIDRYVYVVVCTTAILFIYRFEVRII